MKERLIVGLFGICTCMISTLLADAGDLVVNNLNVQERIGAGPATTNKEPVSTVDVDGSVSIGSGYYGIYSAPADSLIVQGDIGVGTKTPTAYSQRKVHIRGTSPGLALEGTAAAQKYSIVVNGDGALGIYDETNNAYRLLLDRTGLFGLGSTMPSNKLEVSGAIVVGAAYVGKNAAPTGGAIIQGSVGVGTTNPLSCADRELHICGNSAALTLEGTVPNQKYSFVVNGAGDLGIYDESHGAYRLTMDEDGNFGIGTNDPARRLHVTDAMRIEPRLGPPSGTPAKGDIYMDSATNKLFVYDGSDWRACW